MIAIFAEQISCSGDTHEYVIAAFTTQEKAESVLIKLKDHFPQEHFCIMEYNLPKVDPDFEDILLEGTEEVPDEPLAKERDKRDSEGDSSKPNFLFLRGS